MPAILLALFLSLSAHAFSKPAPAPSPSPSPSAAVPAGPLKIQFDPIEYYSTPAQRVKVASAAKKVNSVLQSKCFSDFMGAQKLTWTGGRTPAQVVAHIQGLQGVVPVKFYYSRWSSAVAYRQPPEATIHLNTKFLGAWSEDCEIGSTMAHEMLHALGEYDHSYQWTQEREYTIPYKVGGSTERYGGDAFSRCCH